jgi:hypothetical protein
LPRVCFAQSDRLVEIGLSLDLIHLNLFRAAKGHTGASCVCADSMSSAWDPQRTSGQLQREADGRFASGATGPMSTLSAELFEELKDACEDLNGPSGKDLAALVSSRVEFTCTVDMLKKWRQKNDISRNRRDLPPCAIVTDGALDALVYSAREYLGEHQGYRKVTTYLRTEKDVHVDKERVRRSLKRQFPTEVASRTDWKGPLMIRMNYYAPYYMYSWYVAPPPPLSGCLRLPSARIGATIHYPSGPAAPPQATHDSRTPIACPPPPHPQTLTHRHIDINEKILPCAGLRWNMAIDGRTRRMMCIDLV